MVRRAESQYPASGRAGPSSAEAPESAPQHTLISGVPVGGTLVSLPSPDARAPENTCTVEVCGAPTPDLQGQTREPQESGAMALLRAWTPGVTHEHAGRYSVSDDEAKSELGRGGIGRVFVALDGHLEREVAIKELLPAVVEADGPAALQAVTRFLREARVTGRLEHPNIVPVYELGKRADGTLYYTMRVVRGRTLSRAIAEARTLSERLALVNHFSGLCQAMAYAHSRGVVHRDIKPDNVMIGEFGETVVLDWGMAKVTGVEVDGDDSSVGPPREQSDGELTIDGSLCGTPLYMSPEQAEGLVKEVDERSDVWALGVVLHTILLGRPPFSGRTIPEIVAKVKAGAFERLRVVDPEIPRELAAVAERALRPKKEERYESAREIARDIQAYQAGARVLAYEYSSWELAKRFIQRQRAAVTASAIGLFAVALLGAASYERLVTERDRAVLAEQRAVANERAAKQSESRAKLSLSDVLVEKAQQALSQDERIDAELFSAHALALGESPEARGILMTATSSRRPEPRERYPELRGCKRAAFTFADRRAACAREGSIEVWDLTRRARLWARERLPSQVASLAFASSAPYLGLALEDGTVELRRSNDSELIFERKIAAPTSIAVSSDGAYVALGSSRGIALLWETQKPGPGRPLALGQAVSAVAFARGARAVAVGGELGALSTYSGTEMRRQVLPGHAGTVRALSFADQGRHLASAGADRMVRFWDAENRTQIIPRLLHSDAVSFISWSEDKRFFAYGGKDRSFAYGELRGAGQRTLVRQQDESVELALLSPDGTELVTSTQRDGFELWSLAPAAMPFELAERGNVLALSALPGDRELVSAGLGQNGVCLWSLSLGECSTRLPVRMPRVRALAVSPDGSSLALAGSGAELFVWDLKQRMPRHALQGHADEARAVVFSADGALLASAGLDGRVRVFDAQRGSLIREIVTSAPLQALRFIGRTRQLISGDRDGTLARWEAETGKLLGSFRAHDDWVLGLSVSFDGKFVASAGADRRVRVWETQTHERVLDLAGHEGKIFSVDHSPDGALLASAGEDKATRIWEARSGRLLAVLPLTVGAVRVVRFARDKPLLLTGSDDGAIRLFRLTDLRTPGPLLVRRVEQTFKMGLSGSRVVRQ